MSRVKRPADGLLRSPAMSSTPEALWTDPAVRRLRPAAVLVRGLRHAGQLLDLDLVVPVGWRLLVVSQPEEAARDLLRVLAGLARPSAGNVWLAGLDPAASQRAGGLVSYVGPQAGLYTWMTPREALALSARLTAQAAERIDGTLARYGLAGVAETPMRRLGASVAQRVALAAAVLTDPEILLLDDPLSAIDVDERLYLLSADDRRRTMLMASRFPSREAGVCDHLCFVKDGRVALLAPMSALADEGLPLSRKGIEALVERREGSRPAAMAAASTE